jgi:tetratricopeptide (TPR) repeat protein
MPVLADRARTASAIRRIALLILLLPILPLCAAPALAQNAGSAAAEKQAAIDKLLGTLKSAPNEQVAGPLEQQVRQLWLNAGTPAVTLLISRALREMKANASQEAIDDFTAAITLDPTLAEAYHQRAIARFRAGDTGGAIADIEAALQREPRSFAALETLTGIAESRKDWKGAYEAWQKVLEIDPKTPGGQDRLKDLRRHALGEEA